MSHKKLALIILAVLVHQFILFLVFLAFIIISAASDSATDQNNFQPKESNTIRST